MAAHSNFSRWRWAAFLLSTLWVSIGCTPATLSMFFMPFSDDRIQPPCHLAKSKEATICIVTNSAALETRPDMIPAENELAEMLSRQLVKAGQENKEKIKVVSPAKVRTYQQGPDVATRSLADVGKHFKADYVISLEINSMTLYERGSSQMLYRGNTEIHVQVVDVTKPAGEGTIYTETYRREFPLNGPRDATDPRETPRFRQQFLNAVATDLTRMFTPYASDRRHVMD